MIDGSILVRQHICSDCHIFPREEPMSNDYELWNSALRKVCTSTLELRQPLGPYLREPHRIPCWFTNGDATEVYRPRTQDFVEMYDLFTSRESSHNLTTLVQVLLSTGPALLLVVIQALAMPASSAWIRVHSSCIQRQLSLSLLQVLLTFGQSYIALRICLCGNTSIVMGMVMDASESIAWFSHNCAQRFLH